MQDFNLVSCHTNFQDCDMNCEIIQKQTPKVMLSLSWQAPCHRKNTLPDSEAPTISSTDSYSNNEKELESCYWGKKFVKLAKGGLKLVKYMYINTYTFIAQLMSNTPLSANCRLTNRFCSTEYLCYHVLCWGLGGGGGSNHCEFEGESQSLET